MTIKVEQSFQTFPSRRPIHAIANPNLMALTSGAVNQDIVHLPANRYRIASYPFVGNLSWKPFTVISARSPHTGE